MVYRMPQKTWLVQEEVILCTNGGKTFNWYGKIYGGTGTMKPSGKSNILSIRTEYFGTRKKRGYRTGNRNLVFDLLDGFSVGYWNEKRTASDEVVPLCG